MDKNTYTYVKYEYLPVSNVTDIDAEEANQFVVVQDDGTLVVNRDVQYEAVQEKKDETGFDDSQSCTVYDITPQHYFVDVANSTQLIVPENFLLAESSNNLFGNSYVLQTIPSASTDQLEEVNIVEQFNETESLSEPEAATSDANKNVNLTEVTLDDDQYNMLQQKGWVLLEIQNKVYMLDTLGLHDISTNSELIQQLKDEIEHHPVLNKPSVAKEEKPDIKQEFEDVNKTHKEEEEKPEIPLDNITDSVIEIIPENTFKEDDNTPSQKSDTETVCKNQNSLSKPHSNSDTHNTTVYREGKGVVIKTDLCFKNIPSKIELGRLVNGQKLFAYIKRKSNPLSKNTQHNDTSGDKSKNNEKFFEDMIYLAMNKSYSMLHDETNLAEAKDILTKLLNVPSFQETAADSYIFITKSIKTKQDDAEIEKTMPVFITGRVATTSEEGTFIHIPDLLKKLMTDPSQLEPPEDTKLSTDKVLHIHIEETKSGDRVVAISGTFVKRQLPDIKSRREPHKRVYACSACAKIFPTELELTNHQVTQCLETDSEDKLTIDTDKIVKENGEKSHYYVKKTGKGTTYECIQCAARFNKVSNCIRHNKTHNAPKLDKVKTDTENKVVLEPTHKCNMCSSSYYHPSSLSKHIVSAHIKQKIDIKINN